jgi:uncharacterized protein YfkK (UPF0435 family)
MGNCASSTSTIVAGAYLKTPLALIKERLLNHFNEDGFSYNDLRLLYKVNYIDPKGEFESSESDSYFIVSKECDIIGYTLSCYPQGKKGEIKEYESRGKFYYSKKDSLTFLYDFISKRSIITGEYMHGKEFRLELEFTEKTTRVGTSKPLNKHPILIYKYHGDKLKSISTICLYN